MISEVTVRAAQRMRRVVAQQIDEQQSDALIAFVRHDACMTSREQQVLLHCPARTRSRLLMSREKACPVGVAEWNGLTGTQGRTLCAHVVVAATAWRVDDAQQPSSTCYNG